MPDQEDLRRPPSEEFDREVDALAAQFGAVGAALATLVAAAAAGKATEATLRRARATAQSALESLLAASVLWINAQIPRVYQRGIQQSLSAISGASGGDADQEDLRRQADEAMRRNEHRAAMESLAESLRDDLAGAIEGMGRDANRALGEIRRRNAAQALASGDPLGPSEDFAAQMREKGIRFTDKSGRRWTPEAYARMSLRTHVATVLNAGHINRALEMGSRHVRVFDGGPGDVDQPCLDANGEVWHVAYAAAHMLQHPNCRRSFAAMQPGYSGKVDREAA